MAGRIVRRARPERVAERALEDQLDAIEDDHLEAKAAHAAAVAGGDRQQIVAAKAAKLETGGRLNETRDWLRREQAVIRLATRVIPELEQRLAGPILVKHGKNDAVEDPAERARLQQVLAARVLQLYAMAADALEVRRQLAELGATFPAELPEAVDPPPGSVDVGLPAVSVKPAVNMGGR